MALSIVDKCREALAQSPVSLVLSPNAFNSLESLCEALYVAATARTGMTDDQIYNTEATYDRANVAMSLDAARRRAPITGGEASRVALSMEDAAARSMLDRAEAVEQRRVAAILDDPHGAFNQCECHRAGR